MAATSMLQMIILVLKFDGTDYVQWSRSFNDILQISWPFLRKIVSELGKPEPTLRGWGKDPNEGRDNAGHLMNVNPPMLAT